jgi:hypothetical protein
MPMSSLSLFYAGVFCLFAVLGFMSAMMRTTRLEWRLVAVNVLLCGGLALLLAITAVRQRYLLFPVILVVQFPLFEWVSRQMDRAPELASVGSLHAQLKFLLWGGIVAVYAGYSLFMFFFSREGTRFFGVQKEIALAREMHQALVPTIERSIGDFEIYGASVPSGEVGGDLVDLVERDGQWTAYVADVSGHGVSPGVLMAMMKATVRSRILAGAEGASLLQGVHETLFPLKTSNMFVTAGLLQVRDGKVTLALAGHPALLHWHEQSGQVEECPSMDLPLGILPEQTFQMREIDCRPGDILLLLTDGISEVSNKTGAELGLEPLKSRLQRWSGLPLPEIFHNLRQVSLQFGKQEDDQTMLLVRKARRLPDPS